MLRFALLPALILFSLAGCGEKAKPSSVKIGLQPNAPAEPASPAAQPKPISRDKVEAAIKLFTQRLGERYRSDPKWVQRFKTGDQESINEILRPACKESHLTQEEYEWAIDENEELSALQHRLISDAILGPLDPAKESAGAKKPE